MKSIFLSLLMVVAGIFSFSFDSKAALCDITGGEKYKGCKLPEIRWQDSLNRYHGDKYSAAEGALQDILQNACPECNYGMKTGPFTYIPASPRCSDNSTLTSNEYTTFEITSPSNLVFYVWAHGQTPSKYCDGTKKQYHISKSGWVTAVPICPEKYSLIREQSLTVEPFGYVCVPPTDKTYRPSSLCTDKSTEGCDTAGNPVRLSDRTKVDYKQDLTTGGPFPIIWGRAYTTASGWNFTQLRTGVSSTTNTKASLVLDRGDGTFLEMAKDGQASWQPTFSSQMSNNRILTRVTEWNENGSQKGFVVTNRRGEKEYFNFLGQLSRVENAEGFRHHYTYDSQGRLQRIEDDFGHFIEVAYAKDEGRTPLVLEYTHIDSDGNPFTTTYTTQGSTLSPHLTFNLVEFVTNGVETMGYGWTFAQNNGSKWRHNLTEVVNADQSVISYTYGETIAGVTASKYEMTGIYDETGQRYATYQQKNNIVSSEWHGGNETSATSPGATNQLFFSSNKVTDGLGKEFNYSTNAALGKVTGYTKDCSWCSGLVAKSVVYDEYGNPTSITDFNGSIEKRTYDTERGLPLTFTYAFGTPLVKTTTINWHAQWPVPLSVTEPVEANGQAHTRTTTYTYLPTKALPIRKEISVSSGEPVRAWVYTYTAQGLMESMTDPKGMVTRYAYSLQGELTSTTVAYGTPMAQTSTFGDHTVQGQPSTLVDANGLTSRIVWNDRHLPTQISVGAQTGPKRTRTIAYWPTGLTKKVTNEDGTAFEMDYNVAQKLIESRHLSTNGTLIGKAVIERDTMSNITALLFYDGQGALVQKNAYQYDALNRLSQTVGAQNQASTHTYDAEGYPAGTTNPLNATTTTAVDALGRIKTITDAANEVFSLSHTPTGDVKTATDAKGVATTYTYNGFGDLTSLNSPDQGTWILTYNAAGQKIQATDPRGVISTTAYDVLGRITAITYEAPTPLPNGLEGGTVHQSFGYDSCENGKDRLCSITDSSGTTTYTYNLWGEVTEKAWTGKAGSATAGVNLVVGYGYNSATGQVTSITLPSGNTQQVAYGTNGLISGITYKGNPVVSQAQWNATGKLLGWAWPQAVGWSGVHDRVAFSYDLDGRAVKLKDLDDRDLVWDAGDRLVGVNDTANPDNSQIYGYDSLNRLTSAEVGVWNSSTGFGYDAVGNRTSAGELSGVDAWQYTYGLTHNRLVSQVSVVGGTPGQTFTASYDAMGNLVHDGIGLQLGYDATGRLVQGSKGPQSMTAVYNALGQRLVKASGSTVRVYAVDEAGRPLGVYVVDAAQPNGYRVEEEYVHLDGWRPVAVVRPDAAAGMGNPKVYPILSDHLGTPRKVLDGDTGEVRWSWDAKQPFGHELPNETPTAGQSAFTFDLRFPGQRFDEETGLFHNGFRDYHSGLGRYVQSDPLGLKAGWNTFSYTESSPLMRTDPRGLDWFRDPQDKSEYSVGRLGNPIVPPEGPISKFIEHCVPAGKTFGEIHDQRVDTLKKGGVSDWKANIPTMPGAYMDAFAKEDQRTWAKVERWWWNLWEFDKPQSDKP